ncbi:S8 family serine peptidase [Rheinheimera sp.]|uniref:S8 family serine peptidase n=1 Tax=Rheinheimera sp. TaxID=1869214 RepID=UPI00307EC793
MKLKTIAYAVAGALSGIVVAHAATGQTPSQPGHQASANALQPVKVSAEQLKKRQHSRAARNSLQTDDGLNVQLQPKKVKFVRENDILGEQVYIIRLRHSPVSQYQGGINGLKATQLSKAEPEQRLFEKGEPASASVREYQQFLLAEQQTALTQISQVVGTKAIRQHFVNALNGFSLTLTQDEAEKIAALPEVVSVQRSKLYQLHTDIGPKRISADKVWTGQTSQNTAFKGEGTIVGIIDTGVNTDHPAFADIGQDGYDHVNPLGQGNYLGDCALDEFTSRCNDKLIGVRSYKVITDTYDGLYPAVGEDVSGHGSHTASTAAGNVLKNVDYVVPEISAASDGRVIKEALFPEMSGVAPHANIISYQVCYPLEGCPGEALIAAIEDAVSDGVDAINFSIGNVMNTTSPWEDSIELAFLGAHQAGIAVAASAGNAGTDGYQELGTYIDHVSPWLLNVAASSTGRTIEVDTQLQDFNGGSSTPVDAISGGGINQSALTGIVVKAADFGNEQCTEPFAPGTFDHLTNSEGAPYLDASNNPANIIVACQRGTNGRVEKSSNVAAGGAEGFILYNASDYGDEGTVVKTDVYAVPGIHISSAQWWNSLNNWLGSDSLNGHQLTISATSIGRVIDDAEADKLADFSSRGPGIANPEHLVPSVTAPGVDIYAATNDESPFAERLGETPVTADYGVYSGTSMAAPHVAGALALLSQAHPDWTVAQKQSALQLTAEPVVTYAIQKGQPWEKNPKAEVYRAGTGRINVASAIDAGLLMDESYDNMLAANPANGGLVHKLNLPEMVNFSCKPSCSWVRTFTATKDGSWSLSTDEVTNWSPYDEQRYVQQGVKLEIVPAKFSLKAGETQTIMLRASVTNTQDVAGNSEAELHSHLLFKEDNGKAPDMRLPVVFQYDNGGLPERVSLTAHRNQSSYSLKNIPVPVMTQGVTRTYAPVKAERYSITLPKDDDFTFPWPLAEGDIDDNKLDEATHSFWIDVPANSKRLVVENLRRTASSNEDSYNFGNVIVYLGKDFNNNGKMDQDTEMLCVSWHVAYNNYCNVNDPEPGKYFAVLYNANDYMTPGTDSFEYTYAVVSNQEATDINVSVPAQSDGKTPVTAQINWSMPDMENGDLYYTGFDIGTSAVNAGNVGFVPFKLNRGVDDVSLSADKTTVRVGQPVTLTLNALPNLTGSDRDFTLTATIPAGLELTPDNVSVSDDSIVTAMILENGVLTLKGTQPDTEKLKPAYQISSSDEDEMCRVPDFGQGNDRYVNLSSFGFGPSFGDAPGDLRNGTMIPYNLLFNDGGAFTLYNNQQAPSAAMFVRGNGNVTFDGAPYFFPMHYPFPYDGFPDQAIGTLWRGWGGNPFTMDASATPFAWDSGITLASTQSGWAIVEWDGMRTMPYLGMDDNWEAVYGEKEDRFEFELIFNNQTRFGKGEYEMIMAYNQLEFAGDNRGSVGVQGYIGARTAFGPLEGYLGSEYAFDDLDSKLSVGKVLCYNYVGPESSQFEVTLNATVAHSAIGKDLTLHAVSQVEGMEDIQMSHSLTVPGNLTLGVIRNATVVEDGELTGIQVLYADENNGANSITVSGEHVTATVDGHQSGATFSLKPDADFTGTTTVTVTVADLEQPDDKTSTSFELTVTPINDAPVAKVASSNVTGTAGNSITLDASGSMDPDGDTLSYSWKQTAGSVLTTTAAGAKLTLSSVAAGNYSFEVTVSDGELSSTAVVAVTVQNNQVTTTVTPKSSGAFGIWSLLLVLAMAGRGFRRKAA